MKKGLNAVEEYAKNFVPVLDVSETNVIVKFPFKTRKQACETFDKIQGIIDFYGECSVFDLIELLGMQFIHLSYGFYYYGWRNLTGSDFKRIKGKWYIVLPIPEKL